MSEILAVPLPGQSVSISASSDEERIKDAIAAMSAQLVSLAQRMAMQPPQTELLTIRQEHKEISKNLAMVLSTHRMLNKKHKTSSSGPRAMVPPGDLPVFQWSGNVVDPHKTVFETVEECLDRLEDVILSYRQEMDNNWFLLLPRMLSLEQRSWFDAHLHLHPERPWSFACHVIIK
ncbi:hypothetical protein DFQ30_005179, partial [Apophysomyces sp. BC1015]